MAWYDEIPNTLNNIANTLVDFFGGKEAVKSFWRIFGAKIPTNQQISNVLDSMARKYGIEQDKLNDMKSEAMMVRNQFAPGGSSAYKNALDNLEAKVNEKVEAQKRKVNQVQKIYDDTKNDMTDVSSKSFSHLTSDWNPEERLNQYQKKFEKTIKEDI